MIPLRKSRAQSTQMPWRPPGRLSGNFSYNYLEREEDIRYKIFRS